MDENWLQSRVGSETEILREFEDSLAELLSSEWNGEPNVGVEARPTRAAQRRRQLWVILAPAAVVAVVTVAVGITRSVSKPAIGPPVASVSDRTVPDTPATTTGPANRRVGVGLHGR